MSSLNIIENTLFHSSKRLGYDETEVLLCLFIRSYPELVLNTYARLKELLPEFIFEDYSLIPAMLEEYCTYRNIKASDLKGNRLEPNFHDHRKEFLAVLLMCYHPEKLHKITRKRCQEGLQINAAKALQCNIKTLANILPIVVEWFHRYQSIRHNITTAHALILKKFSY